jgi:hypothetical protein
LTKNAFPGLSDPIAMGFGGPGFLIANSDNTIDAFGVDGNSAAMAGGFPRVQGPRAMFEGGDDLCFGARRAPNWIQPAMLGPLTRAMLARGLPKSAQRLTTPGEIH